MSKEHSIFGRAQQPGRWYKDGSGFRDASEFDTSVAQAERVFLPVLTDWKKISSELERIGAHAQ